MSTYKQLLQDWGLQSFVENFEREGINDESFPLIDNETVKVLVPMVGPRLIFLKMFQEYKETGKNLGNNVASQVASDGGVCIVEDTLSVISTDTFDSGSIYSYVPDSQFQSVLFPEMTNKSKLNSSLSTLNVTEKESLNKSEDGEGASCVGKKRKMSITDSVFSMGLESVLQKYPDGKLILNCKEKLCNELRNKLTKVVITELYATYGISNIKADILTQSAEEICHLFPSENKGTYYVPYNAKNKSGPKGKLYVKLINTRSSLKLATASKSPAKSPNKISQEEEENPHLLFLKSGTEPIPRVFEAWEQTHSLRRRKFLHCGIGQLFSEIPGLKLNFGIELIETDFNKIYPDKQDIIYTTWEKFI